MALYGDKACYKVCGEGGGIVYFGLVGQKQKTCALTIGEVQYGDVYRSIEQFFNFVSL